MNFYTADPHFGHESIMRFCNRPFASVAEMDERIIANYKAAMSPKDDLYIIGDFAFAKMEDKPRLERLLKSIPGRKHLVKGNHDREWVSKLSGWHTAKDLVEIKEDGQRLTLCHYPMITFPGARHGALQLFGHVHDNWAGSRNSINVGVDQWDFHPVTLGDIRARAKRLPVNPLWSELEPGCEL